MDDRERQRIEYKERNEKNGCTVSDMDCLGYCW